MPEKCTLRFTDEEGSFSLENPDAVSGLYFPLANSAGMMSSVTPSLGGDSKTGQHSFLLAPVSVEDLHASRSTRNFWFSVEGKGAWSTTGESAWQRALAFEGKTEQSRLEAGFLWQKVTRVNAEFGLKAEILSFVPCTGDTVELMRVRVTNISQKTLRLVPTAAVPVYGRSADNIRDHRHVTSLLHRVRVTENGVEVKPSLSFNEKGHTVNKVTYAVYGATGEGEPPVGFFPLVEDFVGEGGSFDRPEAVIENRMPTALPGDRAQGFEAIGALRFGALSLKPQASADYLLALCVDAPNAAAAYLENTKFEKAFADCRRWWSEKLNIRFQTGDADFDRFLRWVSCEPVLRRIYGCSFLPHHDYGRGGRGWRDLWQDCLALLLMEPEQVGDMLYKNCAGIRFDGSNATIIGAGQGEFIADRNNIPRVWMDHGAWPLNTIRFYIDQTGDLDLLLKKQTYFKDAQLARCAEHDGQWSEGDGTLLRTKGGEVWRGTVLEHLLIENLTAYYNVGRHGIIRLEGADWNDALDMAAQNGESVAFTSMYCGNLRCMAELLRALHGKKGVETLTLAREVLLLLGSHGDSVGEKHTALAAFFQAAGHTISGETAQVETLALAADLERKAQQLSALVSSQERVHSREGFTWLNGYYDNDARQVEGENENGVRMMLTGQVFAVMFGVADETLVREIVCAADRYLFDAPLGGYRLNTDFHELKTNLGRQFGFAYGHKENGAVFSHMAVMYANALYRRGFVREGFRALDTLCRHCMDFEKSRIYPGIPEYIGPRGRGMYHYLTGAASWLMLTVLTESFGICGTLGRLTLRPKLVAEQFDKDGDAACESLFGGRTFKIVYHNPQKLDYGQYAVGSLRLNGMAAAFEKDGPAVFPDLTSLCDDSAVQLDIYLERKQSND